MGERKPTIGRSALETRLAADGGIRIENSLHDLFANDEHLVALVHATAQTDDEHLDISYAEVLHFNDAGQIAKRQAFPADIWAALKIIDTGD